MQMREIIFFLIILLTGIILFPLYAQEKITITTYYPAPYGVYLMLRVEGWDAVYRSKDNVANKEFHLIGTYHGWDPAAVYIAGYNYYNPEGGNVNKSYAKKVYFGKEKVTIDLKDGKVGIGVKDPQEKLEVDGNIKIEGSITVCQ